MPSRNRSAKACEPAHLAANHTAPLADFSDIVTPHTTHGFFNFAPAPGETGTMAQARTRCPARGKRSLGYSFRGIIVWPMGSWNLGQTARRVNAKQRPCQSPVIPVARMA